MASEFVFGAHDAKSVTTVHHGLFATSRYDDRWIEQFYGRHPSLQKEEPYRFKCTQLVHFTDHVSAKSIGNLDDPSSSFAFKFSAWNALIKKTDNNPQKNPGETIRYLSWWMAYRPDDWRTTVEEQIPDLRKKYENVLGNSAAFDGDNEFGPLGFVVSWKDIRKAYAESRGCCLDEVELRVLGTFRYSAEIMYAVLVCIKEDRINWKRGNAEGSFPPVADGGTEAFEFLDDDKFQWKVYSTIGYGSARPRVSGIRWTWDNVSFAFFAPEKDGILKISPELFAIDDKISIPSRFWKNYKDRQREQTAARKVLRKLREKIEKAKIEKKKKLEKRRINELARSKKLRILF